MDDMNDIFKLIRADIERSRTYNDDSQEKIEERPSKRSSRLDLDSFIIGEEEKKFISSVQGKKKKSVELNELDFLDAEIGSDFDSKDYLSDIEQIDYVKLDKMPKDKQLRLLKKEYLILLDRIKDISGDFSKVDKSYKEQSVEYHNMKKTIAQMQEFIRIIGSLIPDGAELKNRLEAPTWSIDDIEDEMISRLNFAITRAKNAEVYLEQETADLTNQIQGLKNKITKLENNNLEMAQEIEELQDQLENAVFPDEEEEYQDNDDYNDDTYENDNNEQDDYEDDYSEETSYNNNDDQDDYEKPSDEFDDLYKNEYGFDDEDEELPPPTPVRQPQRNQPSTPSRNSNQRDNNTGRNNQNERNRENNNNNNNNNNPRNRQNEQNNQRNQNPKNERNDNRNEQNNQRNQNPRNERNNNGRNEQNNQQNPRNDQNNKPSRNDRGNQNSTQNQNPRNERNNNGQNEQNNQRNQNPRNEQNNQNQNPRNEKTQQNQRSERPTQNDRQNTKETTNNQRPSRNQPSQPEEKQEKTPRNRDNTRDSRPNGNRDARSKRPSIDEEEINTNVLELDDTFDATRVGDVDPYIESLSEEAKYIIKIIGEIGVSRNNELKTVLTEREGAKPLFYHGTKFQKNPMSDAVNDLIGAQILVAEQVKLGTQGGAFKMYELTDLGKQIYFSMTNEIPVKSEIKRLIKQHASAEHGFLIKDSGDIFREMGYTVYTERKDLSFDIGGGKRKDFDLIIEKDGHKSLIEVERGTHNEEDFFKAMDKIRQVTDEFYFICPSEDILFNKTKRQFFMWIQKHLGGMEFAKGIKANFTTFGKLRQGKKPIWDNIEL